MTWVDHSFGSYAKRTMNENVMQCDVYLTLSRVSIIRALTHYYFFSYAIPSNCKTLYCNILIQCEVLIPCYASRQTRP